MKPSISMIVPALDEENDLGPTIQMLLKAIGQKFSDYEILIFNDGSQDKTGLVADQLAAKNNHIRVIHNPGNMGLGYNYRKGVELASKEYIGWVPGKNSIPEATLNDMFNAIGQADIVAVYILTETRSKFRQAVSQIFTGMMNLLFGLNLKYFNGPNILKSDLVKNVKMSTNSFAFMAEIMVRLVKSGHSYVEVGLHNRNRMNGSSKAFVFRNFVRVVKIVLRLFWEIQVVETLNGGHEYREQAMKVDQQLGSQGS